VDRAALGAADAATVRLVGIRRRFVEQQIKYAARMKVACVKGLEFAGRMFEVQQMDVEGLTEDKIKAMKVKVYYTFLLNKFRKKQEQISDQSA
jgi:hypothetical protein